MAALIVLFLVQLLALNNVLCYSSRDYIFAYIPIEEFAYLANAQIEIPAITSSNVMYTDGFDIGTALYVDELITPYCNGRYNSGSSMPKYSSQYSVYPSASGSTYYQPSSLPSVTMLPPVSVPTPRRLPTTSLPISTTSYSTLPQKSILKVDQYEFTDTTEEIDYYSGIPKITNARPLPLPPRYAQNPSSIYSPLSSSTVSVPYYGKKTFSGMVPASGTVKIYGTSY